MPFKSRRSLLAALCLSALVPPLAHAQSQPAAWPAKPIRIVVGFAPGGTTDPYARMLGEYLGQKLGVPVVVENRPGANGFISLEALSRAAPDGYTIGVIATPHVGGVTEESLRGIGAAVVRNIEKLKRGELPEHCVNADQWPSVRDAMAGAV